VIGCRVRNCLHFAAYILHLIHHPPQVPHPFTWTVPRGASAFLLSQVHNPPLLGLPIPASLPRISTSSHPHRYHLTPTIPAHSRTPISARYLLPHFLSVKLSKETKRTYLSCFFASISNLYAHLLKRLQRLCRMRVGAFEDRSEHGPPPTSTAASGMVRDMVDRGPSFDMVVIGCGGGPFETNLSA